MVLIVPMRNWNTSWTRTPISRSAFWSYLWGIETSVEAGIWQRVQWGFWSYLWGIETKCRKSFFAWSRTWFWSYLWGIETRIEISHQLLHLGRFDRTYEELKLECRQVAGKFLCRFDRTYEELKRFTTLINLKFSALVLIVPMRNWNPMSELRKRSTKSQVLIVPMRNWNTYGSEGRVFRIPVLIVPMRNWNRSGRVKTGTSASVLIVPMRNWNPRIEAGADPTGEGFWSYLWGIETGMVIIMKTEQQPQVLIVPMRNWNIEGNSLAELFDHRFDRTYEELKPPSSKRVNLSRQTRFDRTYEELKLKLALEYTLNDYRFDRTYEELKLVVSSSRCPSRSSFDRTYEELKPDQQLSECQCFSPFWSYLWGIETGL